MGICTHICVPDMTMVYIRGWMQMVYCQMIYSPETKQNKTVRYLKMVSRDIITVYIQNGDYSLLLHNYVLCARWVFFVTPDSSSNLPGCSMGVLPSPLLLMNCLSCSLSRGPGPPPSPPPPGWAHFPQGPGTFPLLRQIQYDYLHMYIDVKV